MLRWTRPLLILVLLLIVPLPAWSVIIVTKNNQKIRGYLVNEDVEQVIFRRDGSVKQETLPRAAISKVYSYVDTKRLVKLKKDEPKGYFDYAEELTKFRDDPEARDTALRLYLIAAHMDAPTFGHRSLSKMIDLARSPAEERTFRALAYLLDPGHERKILAQAGGTKTASGKVGDEAAKAGFLKALRYLRRGRTDDALRAADTASVRPMFDSVVGFLSFQEFKTLCLENKSCVCNATNIPGRVFCKPCKGTGAVNNSACATCRGKGWTLCEHCQGRPRPMLLSQDQLLTVLRLEIELESAAAVAPTPTAEPKAPSWSALISDGTLNPAPLLALEYLTELDPRKCLFRTGDWVAP